MTRHLIAAAAAAALLGGCAGYPLFGPIAGGHGAPSQAGAAGHGAHASVSDEVVLDQRVRLAASTRGKGFGPQAPRDIDSRAGNNPRQFNLAPKSMDMNLCNIHFHRNAEHRGGDFRTYAGHGDGHGNGSGFVFSGTLSPVELTPLGQAACPGPHGGLVPGDTIEVHYVHSTAQVDPGPTLGACLSDATKNPQLRVEAQVYVLVNDVAALDFEWLTRVGRVNGLHQALYMPRDTGRPVEYAGSTTGPGYNEKGSPFEVSWAVRPRVAKVNIATVARWCSRNVFKEDHAHGVRNLVLNRELLSSIGR